MHKSEFKKRHKKSDETIREYGYELRRMAARSFPSHDERSREEWIIDQFQTGLCNVGMQRHVFLKHPKTLEEAMSAASDYEMVETTVKKPTNVASLQSKDSKSLQQEISSLKAKIASLENQNMSHSNSQPNSQTTSQNRNNRSSKIICFNCNEQGHIMRRCPHPKRQSKRQIPVNNQPTGSHPPMNNSAYTWPSQFNLANPLPWENHSSIPPQYNYGPPFGSSPNAAAPPAGSWQNNFCPPSGQRQHQTKGMTSQNSPVQNNNTYTSNSNPLN